MQTARALAVLLTMTAAPWIGAGAQPAPSSDPVVAIVLEREIRESERDGATGIVIGALFAQYEREHGIEASDEEIQAFVVRNREIAEQHLRERQEQIAALRVELASPTLTGEEREKRRSRLELLEKLQRSEHEAESYRQEHPAEMEASEREVAKHFVGRWKLSRSLYERYGGRVIFQQAGPEPVDAYRAFLEEQQEKGAFQILDPSLGKEFWRYFVDDEMHTFFSEDAGRKAMATPWWLMDEPLDE